MKRVIKYLLMITGCFIVLFLGLNITWSLRDKKKLNIYILDKTVTRFDRPEHKSLVWLLNYERFVGPDGKTYKVDEDYYGFFPIDFEQELFDFKSIRINEVDAYADAYDAVYYTDCYGVFSFEWYKGKTKTTHSQKVYGGLNQNDFLLLKKMKEGNKLVIGEYNMFSTPTNALLRSKAESLFDITWTGWSGKSFRTLNASEMDGPPEWMPKLYESQHLNAWPQDKSGVVLVSNDGLIELLVLGEDLRSLFPVIGTTPEYASKLGVTGSVEYDQWFEFITPGGNTVVPSTFSLDVSPEGKKILEKISLQSQFPAVVRATPGGFTFYFAGDFAENDVKMFTSRMAGGKWLNKLLTDNAKPVNSKFFNGYYQPLMRSILNEYYQFDKGRR
jgi:hypothetical protein